MLDYACTIQLEAQVELITAQRAEPQSADLSGFSFVAISNSYV